MDEDHRMSGVGFLGARYLFSSKLENLVSAIIQLLFLLILLYSNHCHNDRE